MKKEKLTKTDKEKIYARALSRITKNYFQLKEQYANRRKGKE